MSAEPMFIRIIDPQRTFHTHGIPCGFGNRHGLQVRTWAGGRRKLHQAYRNLRRSGIGREDARGFVIDLMLVAPA